jgi:hypothetical protein
METTNFSELMSHPPLFVLLLHNSEVWKSLGTNYLLNFNRVLGLRFTSYSNTQIVIENAAKRI